MRARQGMRAGRLPAGDFRGHEQIVTGLEEAQQAADALAERLE
jgi:hypothetical protein